MTDMPTKEVYQERVKKVLDFFKKTHVATKETVIIQNHVDTDDIRRMITDKILTTSLNYEHNWIIPTKTLNIEHDHWGFCNARIEKYSRTVPIFHIKRNAKDAVSYLVSKRPWGLTKNEADSMLGRDCGRVLNELVKEDAIQERIYKCEKIYLHRVHKRADIQLNCRRTNPRFKKDIDEEKEKVGVISYEDFIKTFFEVVDQMDAQIMASRDRIAALLLMFQTSKTLRSMENWIAFNERIQLAVGMPWAVDHTTLSRAYMDISEDFLKQLFHKLVMRLHEKGVITGKFLVVDATHIYAYCNTRKTVEDDFVEGAYWGNHHGSFYGYKVHILIDSESELPLAMILGPGNEYDSVQFIPLIENFDANYEFEDVLAVLADGAYDVEEFRKIVQTKTGGKFLPACNPRRNSVLKTLKNLVKTLFDKHGEKIQSVQDAFKYLGQRFLTDFNIDIGTSKESKMVELISERLHRPFRAAVERVFSRLKSMTSFERPNSQDLQYVRKAIWFCLVGMLVQALTAIDKGLPGSMRKRTMLA